ncbi:ATP phosphoribosyltransferase regulatory subunit [bioreactor metagenome]|uniref:ATP phosphoribosyltransferase regulatory subunit n=1 Tax=bioreactor metagenome TaxID=1076179 RepID=A0A645IZS5_9ZZZZ
MDLIYEAKKKAVNDRVLNILSYLEDVCNALCSLGYKEYISIDLGMVHHIHYYTGLIFRGYVKGSGENCLAGGRYDTLTQNFGKILPATGFALNTESILNAIAKRGDDPESLRPDLVIHYDEGCLKDAQEFWGNRVKEGLICELSVFSDLESSRKYARLRKVKIALYHISKNGIQPIECREESTDDAK